LDPSAAAHRLPFPIYSAIAESEANPGKPVMTGEEMNWRIFYSNIEASSKDGAARIAIEQFYRSEHRDIGHREAVKAYLARAPRMRL
jgi:hypothetical protein